MVTARGSWMAAAIVAVVCAAVELPALADRSRGEPASGGIRRYVLGEIADDLVVAQEFLVKADGLSSVTIHPRPMSAAPNGVATIALWDVTDAADHDGRVVVGSTTVPLARLVQSDALTLNFTPQRSWHRRYQLTVTVAGASRDLGFGLLAARGEGHRDAMLTVNGTRKWGDLVFETTVAGAVSNFALLRGRLASAGIPAPGVALAVLLAAQYLALAAAVCALLRPIAGSS